MHAVSLTLLTKELDAAGANLCERVQMRQRRGSYAGAELFNRDVQLQEQDEAGIGRNLRAGGAVWGGRLAGVAVPTRTLWIPPVRPGSGHQTRSLLSHGRVRDDATLKWPQGELIWNKITSACERRITKYSVTHHSKL